MKEKLSKGMLKLSEKIVKLRLPIVLFVLLVTVFFTFQIPKIKINSDIVSSLPKNDYAVKMLDSIGDKYEGNSTSLILLETKNVFNPQVINEVKLITDSLTTIQGISLVTSLTNIINIRTTADGMEIGKLVDEENLPSTPQDFKELSKRVFSNEMYRGVIVSEDSTLTAVIVTFAQGANQDSIVNVIKSKVTSIKPTSKVYYTGTPFMMKDVQSVIVRDLRTLLPITTIIIIFVLFLGFRSFRGVILPLLTVGIALVWNVGLMALIGKQLTIISDTIPGILLALGTAYTIHVLNRINEEDDATDKIKSLAKALGYIIVPVFLAYITTAIGFMSFVWGSYLLMIRDFGIFTAIGITFAFLLSITFSPAVISLLNMYRKDNIKQESKLVTKVLEPLSKGVIKRPWTITIVWLSIAAVFGIGITMIVRKVDIVSYFKHNNPTYISQHLVEKKLGGTFPFYINFKGDVQSPEFMEAMYQTEKYLKDSVEHVSYTLSIADLVAQMNDAMGEGKKVPDTRAKIEQLWMLIEGEEVMPQLVNTDLTEAVIQSRFASLDGRDTRKFIVTINNYIKTHKFKGIEMQFAGMPAVYRQLDVSLIRSQFTSLAIAFVLMIIIISLTMSSTKSGLLSAVPLLLTNVIAWGVMGFTKIPLDIATVLVASVTMGVGIDYAVHILSHFNNYFEETNDFEKSITETIRVSGNAIIINVMAVALGFVVFGFSNLVPLQNFGYLMSLSMVVSGFSAVTLLPALLIIINTHKGKRTNVKAAKKALYEQIKN